jgi:predicted permease
MIDWKDYVRKNLAPLRLEAEREMEMVEELAQHLEAVYEDALSDGAPSEEAFLRASTLIKDWQLLECELVRAKHPLTSVFQSQRSANNSETQMPQRKGKAGGLMFGSVLQDLRYAFRMLRKSKVVTTVAVLSLALGIGANTAVFTLVDAVLLKMLPVRSPNELVLFDWVSGPHRMWRMLDGTLTRDAESNLMTSTSFPTLAFNRLHDAAVLGDVFAFALLEQLNVDIDGRAEISSGQVVSGDYYKGLGVSAALGRTIASDDDQETANPVAVISYRYWQRRFGLDPAAIGKEILVNGVPFTIVGATPRGFEGTLDVGNSPDLSIPLAMEPRISPRKNLHDPGTWWLMVMGRLKPGTTPEQVRMELDGIFQQSAAEDRQSSIPDPNEGPGEPDIPRLRVSSGSQGLNFVRESYASPLKLLLAAVGLVLMIACANVANILLARGALRQKEIGVRLALGASRWRLIRQLLTESLVLAVLGGALGVLFAYWGKDLLLILRPWGGAPLNIDLTVDVRVLGFTIAVSLLTGILFGIAPAVRATRVDLTPALKDNARGVVGRSSFILTKGLVITQVALSLLLLVGAGLFVRTLRNLHSVDLGFNAERLLIFRVDPRLSGYKTEQLGGLYDRLVERIEAVPGVTGVTISRHPLLAGSAELGKVFIQGKPAPGPGEYTYIERVRSNFLETMEIPILRGRGLSPKDDEHAPHVAIINQTMASKYFPGEDPIGKRFGRDADTGDIEIVGVSRDAKYAGVRRDIMPTVYLPFAQLPTSLGQMNFAVRTAGEPAELAPAIREAVSQVDKDIPLFEVKTQMEQAEESLAEERLFATLSSFFGVFALLLACLGLYGVMSHAVTRRTNEIGIRMALGAVPGNVSLMVLRETMVLVVIGVGVGLGAALLTTRLVASRLYGLSPSDPAAISAAIVLMMAVAGLAGYLPARRASRVDPIVALRYE